VGFRIRRQNVRRSVSRVLYLYGHLSAKPVARSLMRSTRRVGGPRQPLLSDLAPDGVYQASMSPCCRCALTAPFHRCRKAAVSFLWHFPSGHPARTLSGIVPCGARTFLCAQVSLLTATTRPPDASFYPIVIRSGRSRQLSVSHLFPRSDLQITSSHAGSACIPPHRIVENRLALASLQLPSISVQFA